MKEIIVTVIEIYNVVDYNVIYTNDIAASDHYKL